MISFLFKIYFKMIVSSWKAVGFGKLLLVRIYLLPLFGMFTAITLVLDKILYPEFQRVVIKKPVFIIGHPRSGTTFLHRLIAEGDFVEFKLWEIAFPSLTSRKIIKPFIDKILKSKINFLKSKENVLLPAEVGHKMELDDVEEEELLFVHILNSQFLTFFSPIGFSDWDFNELVFNDQQPVKVQENTMKFLKTCLQRQAYYLKKTRIVGKINFSAMRLKSLFRTFPDARVIYLVRSPLETMPSHFSLDRNTFNHLWGLDKLRDKGMLQRYYQRRYKHNVAFYNYVEDLLENGSVPLNQILVMNYNELRDDPENALQQFFSFTGIYPSDRLKQKIQSQLKNQKRYQAKHRNLDLTEFGISKEQIIDDLQAVFKKYGFSVK